MAHSSRYCESISPAFLPGVHIFFDRPSIISSVWGMENLGRNFGLLLYAPFIGTPSFSYLYAFVSDVHSQGASICVGHNCWQLTFWVTFTTSICGFFISVILWHAWKGLV